MSASGETLTLRNAITDARFQVKVCEGQTVRDAVIASECIAPGNAFSVRDKYGHVVDNDLTTEHADEMLTIGLPGDQVTGGGSLEHVVFSVSEVLGSGMASNTAYDLLKNAIGRYRNRRDRHRSPSASESDKAHTNLLSRDEAIDIAVGLASRASGWPAASFMPVDAYINKDIWRVRVKASDRIIAVYIPPGDPNSVPIRFADED